MLPPGPPYSSGTVGQSRPILPAFTQNSRSTNLCSDHLAICGAASRSKNSRATSRSACSSPVIHAETYSVAMRDLRAPFPFRASSFYNNYCSSYYTSDRAGPEAEDRVGADEVLAGITVVDLSEQVPGPYATRLLA